MKRVLKVCCYLTLACQAESRSLQGDEETEKARIERHESRKAKRKEESKILSQEHILKALRSENTTVQKNTRFKNQPDAVKKSILSTIEESPNEN